MARDDRPERLPFYGAALTVVAFLSCWGASLITVTWVAAVVYGTAVAAAGVGFVMTLRDYS
jgi:hypothetical protein